MLRLKFDNGIRRQRTKHIHKILALGGVKIYELEWFYRKNSNDRRGNAGVDTNVFVLMLMPVLTSCVDFDRFHVKLSVLVSFVVLVGAACKGDAIRGLLSMCQAQRRAAGNRAPPRGQNPGPEVPGSQNLAQEPQDARIQPQSFQEARASENRGRVGK